MPVGVSPSPALPIRDLLESDCEPISQAFAAQGWRKPIEQYRNYCRDCVAGTRTALVAERAGSFAGYITILWQSDYPFFRSQAIPEIADLNVLKHWQRQGIGTHLLEAAEKAIAARSPLAGIGVGLTADYGPAQILYVRRGYLPDGNGLMQHGRQLTDRQTVVVDDELVLYLTKRLAQ